MQVQLMSEEEAHTYHINPFDLTKVWYHGDFPLHDVGILELNRNPENFFAETEQAAFNPMNIIDGIGFSPDKMLQGRLFSYGDAQRYRLGVNHHLIPINRPRCPYHSFIVMVKCERTTMQGAQYRMSQIVMASGKTNHTSKSHLWLFRERFTTTTSESWIAITTHSRASYGD